MSDLIIQIDQGLGRYYALLGDKSYFNKDGVGKFQFHCDESSLDDDEAINDELKEDPSDCMLTDFDKQFPFKEEPDDRATAIFKIIQKCATDPGAYKNFNMLHEPTQLKAKDFELSEDDKKVAEDLHTQQCPSIFDGPALGDAAFMKFTAISHKLKTPYFQFVSDMYQRARVANAHNPDYKLNDWIDDVNNKLVYELKNMPDGAKLVEDLAGALYSYGHRVCPMLMFSPTKAIVDSLPDICADILIAVEFVAKLAADQVTTCPFQFDAMFAFNKAREVSAVVSPKQNGQDDDGGDDDDDDDDDETDDTKQGGDGPFYDVFGDVKKKFALAKLLISAFPIDDDDDEKADGSWDEDDEKQKGGANLRRKNMFFRGFRIFSAELKEKNKGKEMKEYPRNFRFNALIDRRKPNDKDNKDKNILDKDELIFSEPSSNANKLPQGQRSSMAYFNLSRTEMIPPGGDVNGDDQKKKELNAVITSLSACKGAMMALSFHVESADEIRCYLILNGQCIRFMPRDIIDVLPLFFDPEVDGNKNWKTSKEAMELVGKIEKNLVDGRFNAFLQKYQPKSVPQPNVK